MPLLALFYFGPYLLPVLPAYWLARTYGRTFHRSDLVAMFAPIVVYLCLEFFDTRQGLNALGATFTIGVVVALCFLFRGARSLSPWQWALPATTLGVVTTIIAWLNFEKDTFVFRQF